jgi:hypothetical protein
MVTAIMEGAEEVILSGFRKRVVLGVLLLVTVLSCSGSSARTDSSNASPEPKAESDLDRQKRTMAGLRSLGAAVEAYAVDHGFYPVAASIPALKQILEPVHIRDASTVDGWGHTFLVACTTVDYTLCSPGKSDGAQWCTLTGDGGETTDPDDDIIFYSGQFTQWPKGLQR